MNAYQGDRPAVSLTQPNEHSGELQRRLVVERLHPMTETKPEGEPLPPSRVATLRGEWFGSRRTPPVERLECRVRRKPKFEDRPAGISNA